ncbi:MAG TPA: metallophosphoesterase [Saprospiraceae bacterium]|nr:metallophosphoesterase [Saprospiraceae bacterium]
MSSLGKRFQIVSDIHIEKLSLDFTNLKVDLEKFIKPSAPHLIIAGDLGRVENYDNYKNTVQELCGMFKTVILVPGNHEYYSKNHLPIDYINFKLKCLQDSIENLTILLNETILVDDVLIYGSTFWSKCVTNKFLSKEIFKRDKIWGPTMISKEVFNQMHQEAVIDLKKATELARETGKKLVVVTHYPPTFKDVLDPKYYNEDPQTKQKNCMYGSKNDHLLNDSVILTWVYGHTGYNGRVGKLISNQVNRHGYMKDAVLKVKSRL